MKATGVRNRDKTQCNLTSEIEARVEEKSKGLASKSENVTVLDLI